MKEKAKKKVENCKEQGYEVLSDSNHHYIWLGRITPLRADLLNVDSETGEHQGWNIPIDVYDKFVSLRGRS